MKKSILAMFTIALGGSIIAFDPMLEEPTEQLSSEPSLPILPKDVKYEIVLQLLQGNDYSAIRKNIKNLRLASKEFKEVVDQIDKPDSIKELIDLVAQRLPPIRSVEGYQKLIAALLIGTPAALSYAKENGLSEFIRILQGDRFIYHDSVREIKNYPEFFVQLAEALFDAGILITDKLFHNIASVLKYEKITALVKFLVNKGYNFAPLYNNPILFDPPISEHNVALIKFLVENKAPFNASIIPAFEAILEMEREDLRNAQNQYAREFAAEQVSYYEEIVNLLKSAAAEQGKIVKR